MAESTALLGEKDAPGMVLVDVDDTIVQVHGHHKQGASFGYTKVRGLNALLATVSTVSTVSTDSIAAVVHRADKRFTRLRAARLDNTLEADPPSDQRGPPHRG